MRIRRNMGTQTLYLRLGCGNRWKVLEIDRKLVLCKIFSEQTSAKNRIVMSLLRGHDRAIEGGQNPHDAPTINRHRQPGKARSSLAVSMTRR